MNTEQKVSILSHVNTPRWYKAHAYWYRARVLKLESERTYFRNLLWLTWAGWVVTAILFLILHT